MTWRILLLVGVWAAGVVPVAIWAPRYADPAAAAQARARPPWDVRGSMCKICTD